MITINVIIRKKYFSLNFQQKMHLSACCMIVKKRCFLPPFHWFSSSFFSFFFLLVFLNFPKKQIKKKKSLIIIRSFWLFIYLFFEFFLSILISFCLFVEHFFLLNWLSGVYLDDTFPLRRDPFGCYLLQRMGHSLRMRMRNSSVHSARGGSRNKVIMMAGRQERIFHSPL